jgi:hypothetical protein
LQKKSKKLLKIKEILHHLQKIAKNYKKLQRFLQKMQDFVYFSV